MRLGLAVVDQALLVVAFSVGLPDVQLCVAAGRDRHHHLFLARFAIQIDLRLDLVDLVSQLPR